MLLERYHKVWTVEDISDLLGDSNNEELLSIAIEIYAEEFKTFCKECKNEKDKNFETFVKEVLMSDEGPAFVEIMEAYAAKYHIKAAICGFVRNFDSGYTELWINQVVPTSQKDLDELKEMYEEYGKE
jgi:hypothetical protein